MIFGINRLRKTRESSPGGAFQLSPALQRWVKWRKRVKSRRDGPVFSPLPVTIRGAAATVLAVCLAATACGYHRAGNAIELPQNIHTVAIPGFVSHSQTFRIEQLLTDAVVREFDARTQYHVVHDTHGDADATLKATVLSASATPLAYDSTTGRAVSALVTVSVQVTLTDRQGKVLFENPSYLFHDQYEISRDLPSFFQEDSPAVDRLSRDFARTLVANILEVY
jgi:outer membrane lipopolysaccharide assembly protein LptE/RlpB